MAEHSEVGRGAAQFARLLAFRRNGTALFIFALRAALCAVALRNAPASAASRLSPCHLPQRGRLASLNNNLPNHNAIPEHTISGVNDLKEEEKKPIPWEAVDPRPPVIRSGHLENRRQN